MLIRFFAGRIVHVVGHVMNRLICHELLIFVDYLHHFTTTLIHLVPNNVLDTIKYTLSISFPGIQSPALFPCTD